MLVNRLVDFNTHKVVEPFHVDIPEHRKHECEFAAKELPSMVKMLPVKEGLHSISHCSATENYELILNSTWLPQLTVTGLEGLPGSLQDASNSIKRSVTVRCSLRLPPTLPAETAKELVAGILLKEPHPYGAQVAIKQSYGDNGFDTRALDPAVKHAFFEANKAVFGGNEPILIGCGGSIPFMEFFSHMYPQANFLLTGVGFPDSNAHAANENLDLEFCRKLTSAVAITLAKL